MLHLKSRLYLTLNWSEYLKKKIIIKFVTKQISLMNERGKLKTVCKLSSMRRITSNELKSSSTTS